VRAVDPDAVVEEQVLSDFLFEDADLEEGAAWD
jgi:hypothetical protein